ncbi:hypothetical protein PVK06_047731 [Gossypium arboreum]|uniref:Putative plant transposon protein domain-containing protein n=1 Tax=Gossypium arboreum TaxID=29729 RepID=A0ABR0ME26_GOSAR|nr:hypothetical protein PVK06_047731 [Gossypium arboreum]
MTQDATKVTIRKKKVPFTSKSVNDLFNLLDVEEDKYYLLMDNINWDFLQQVLDVVTTPGFQWIIRKYGSHSCQREYLKLVAKVWFYFVRYSFMTILHSSTISMEWMLLLYAILIEKPINVGKLSSRRFTIVPKKKAGKRVHELNQGEQEEPIEPDTEESIDETETEANSVKDTEEEESDKEPKSPKLVEGFENPKPRVEPEEEPVKLSIEPESATPMPTSASTSRK